MADVILAGKPLDPSLVQTFYRHLALAAKKLEGRRHAKLQLDEHLGKLKKSRRLTKPMIAELQRRVDLLVEKEQKILHEDNRYIPVHELSKSNKEVMQLQKLLAGLEERSEKLKQQGVTGLKVKKIEARIAFLKTKLEFLRR